MQKLESLSKLEAITPEFQNLSSSEKNRRRKLLSEILGTVIKEGEARNYSPEDTGPLVAMALELHLTGHIEKTEKAKKSKKRK